MAEEERKTKRSKSLDDIDQQKPKKGRVSLIRRFTSRKRREKSVKDPSSSEAKDANGSKKLGLIGSIKRRTLRRKRRPQNTAEDGDTNDNKKRKEKKSFASIIGGRQLDSVKQLRKRKRLEQLKYEQSQMQQSQMLIEEEDDEVEVEEVMDGAMMTDAMVVAVGPANADEKIHNTDCERVERTDKRRSVRQNLSCIIPGASRSQRNRDISLDKEAGL